MEENQTKNNINIESEILQILSDNEFININLDLKDEFHLITKKDIKLFHFIFLYLIKSSKIKNIKQFFKLKRKNIICKNICSKSNDTFKKRQILIEKFINICLIKHIFFASYLGMSNIDFIKKILKITKIFFLNNYIDEENLEKILYFQIILSLKKENENNNKINLKYNNNIQNIKQIYLVIDYLLSFCCNNNYRMNNDKIKQFNNLVINVIKMIENDILVNYNNIYLLSKDKLFFRIIELSQLVSLNTVSQIIKLLINVYKHKFNIDYVLEDLSNQFLYRIKEETLLNKTNLLMSKNIFLNELFEKEKLSFKKEDIFIKNGFFFNDCKDNGIICDPINKFPSENNGYTIAISFRLMNDIKNKNQDNFIYTIFSLVNKDNNNIMNVFIEDNKLKIKLKKDKKCFELYEISNNSNYVLWIIHKKEKKLIFFLNNCKNTLNNAYYPDGIYKINVGFENSKKDTSVNNFEGIIGTFILFKKCLIKDENDFINITKLTELKGNYEDIIYTNTNRSWAFIDKNLHLILNKLTSDINIYKDIEIIISTRSLGYESDNNTVYSINEFNCNYFKNSEKQPKFYIRNKNSKLFYPVQLNNTIINFLSNHGFLYLQLELYYFINIICSKINENENNKKSVIQLIEQQDVYLNVSRICTLFFFCFDSLNSNINVNNAHYNLIKNELDNFKYTLIDLISICSKYDCKFKTFFLSLFVEKISEKKYFEFCLFILSFEYYDINNTECFDVLFNYLNQISIDDCDNWQIIQIFSKLLEFDKIYLSNEITKDLKKEYSKLMRYLIKKTIDQQVEECLESYRSKIQNLYEQLLKNNILDDDIEELNNENDGCNNRINSDDYNNENNLPGSRTSSKKSCNKILNENDNINNSKKNIEILKLLYKYLKNLYVGINDVKKKYIELSKDRKNIISEFFNNLFNNLCKIYPIEKDEEKGNTISFEKQKDELILAELIKSICIRFLDDLFFDDNIKTLDEKSKKDVDNLQNEHDFRKTSCESLKSSFDNRKTTKRPNLKESRLKSSLKKSDSSGNVLGSFNDSVCGSFISNNICSVSIEEILTSKMEFFDKLILSPYTFKSLFFMLLRDLPNEEKLKIIKDDKKIKKKLLMKDKYFSKTRFLIGIIISLFEKLNSNGYDTLFISKVEIIQYCYDFFIDFFKNILNNYLGSNEGKRKIIKPMINSIFVDKGNNYNIHRLYVIMIDIIFNFNYLKTKEDHNFIKDHLDKLLIKIQNDINEIINKSLYELVDLFYFKLLKEMYVKTNINDKYVMDTIRMIMENIIKKIDDNKINRIIEINCKNTLILLYKIVFYISKKKLILLPENELFLKTVILFLSKFIDNCNILYIKILFPIEDSNPIHSKRKLLIEIIFEIILEMYIDYLRNPKFESLKISEILLKGLFDTNNINNNLFIKIKYKEKSKKDKRKNNETKEVYTPFYIMDILSYININNKTKDILYINKEISVCKQFYELKDYLLSKYKDEYKEDKNLFSVCIIFAIKIILSIKELDDYYSANNFPKNTPDGSIEEGKSKIDIKNNNKLMSNNEFNIELKNQFIYLCKNILKIHKNYTSLNPFKSIGVHSNNLYEIFRCFIVDKLSFVEGDSDPKILELIEKVENHKNTKLYSRVIYTREGRLKLYDEKKYNQIIKEKKNETNIYSLKDSESISSTFDKKSSSYEEKKSINLNNNLKGSYNSVTITSRQSSKFNINNISRAQSQISKKNNIINNKNEDKLLYISTIKFKKDLLRKYFSFYFKKLLSYDEDFLTMKRLYILTYNKEINDIDDYGRLYPIKLKNYITNNYMRIFLKKDFNFLTDKYFKYSHSFLTNKKYNYNFEIQNKYLFPSKSLLDENDSAHKETPLNSKDLIIYECEMLTAVGSIFGNIIVFDNCLLFKSELKNDKRKAKKIKKENENENENKEEKINYLDYACCSLEFDHLNINKKIIIEYNDIKEVINRTFYYSWISLEIFMKNGNSYLFNFFNEETNNDILENLKSQKIQVIRKVSEYFKREEFSKKWKEEKISTFDYLLLLNKLSSRTYNDPNQYLIMPWIFLKEGINNKRNFNIPISVQDEDKQEAYLANSTNIFGVNDNTPTQGNHYSTSAYIYYYLMRTNPFTNDMIKFQSNNFDVPDRQYTEIKQTIYLCQRMNNNRELIPELFYLPEMYINLNDNDFGKQKDDGRVHNIHFDPYAKNPMEFCYILKNMINNDPEINNNINQWFDFIFGINQTGDYLNSKNNNFEDKKKLKLLRHFNNYCYGQYYNIKKLLLEIKKHSKKDNDCLSDIRSKITISISFGQSPYQLFSEVHPSKKIIISQEEKVLSTPNPDNNINLIDNNDNTNNDNNLINQKKKEIYEIKSKYKILYFTKSYVNNYIYCVLSNFNIEIYNKINKKQKNEYILIKTISSKTQFLPFAKTKNNNLIFKPKYLFCELTNSFVFCRTFDKTIRYIKEDNETPILLSSYITCIIKINNSEFITGHHNGKICKWGIYFNNDGEEELNILLSIKSNKSSITSLNFNEKLNIITVSDINTIMIRKNYNFEYLTSIEIKNEENLKKNIIDVKISEYDFIYVSIYIEDNINTYELQGFTLNGTYFGKYTGSISNFEISKTGKLIVGEINKPIIKILNPVNFEEIYSKTIIDNGGNNLFHFHFEKPNTLYYGVKEKDETKIKIINIEENEEKYFL